MTALVGLTALAAALAVQQADTAGRDTVELRPLTVSATRDARDAYRVPLATTRLLRRDFAGGRGMGLDDALTLVPGVVVASRYGTSDVRVTIRGFGARGAGDRSNAGTARGIRVLVDGFPETEPDGRTAFDHVELSTAQAVEVVRSNASAVWGNAAGGVIAISTVPAFDQHRVAAGIDAGSFGLRRARVEAATRVGAGRLAAAVTHATFDGWRAHARARRTVLHVSLLAPLAPATDVGVFAVGSFNEFRIPGPLTRAQAAADPRQANATYRARDERRDNQIARLGVSLAHALHPLHQLGGMLFVSPKVLQRSERGTFRDFTRYHLGGSAVYHGAIPLAGTVATIDAGVDAAWQDGAILFYTLAPDGTRGDSLVTDKREGAGNTGAFVQVGVTPAPPLTLTIGARWDRIAYDYADHLDPALDDRKAFAGVTPKVGATYQLGTRHALYASVGGGIEAPAGNETSPAGTFGEDTVTALNPLLDAIRSTTVELGTRRALTLGRGAGAGELAYDLALYWTTVGNEIVPYQGGRFYFTAGRARRRGAEAALRLAVPPGVAFQTALAWADHRYTRYVVDSVHYGVPGARADYSGNRVVGIPRLTWAASAEVAPSVVRPLALRVGVVGQSSHPIDDAGRVIVPGWTVVNATLRTARPARLGGTWTLAGFVTVENLLDRSYVGSAFLNPEYVSGEAVAFEPALPRNLVLGVTLGSGS